jgi:uncharacterized protein
MPMHGSAPLIGTGVVRHQRLRPVAHAFEYPTYFLMLPMRALRAQPCAALARNRFGLLSFHDRDHGDGGADALAWLEALLQREGIAGADGEVWLHTYPRVAGYAFKPVSFWYCHQADGASRRSWSKSTTPSASATATCSAGPSSASAAR